MDDTEIEAEIRDARLSAHRALLARMLVHLPAPAQAEVFAWLEQAAVPLDGQEDPGAVIVPGVPGAMARADELNEIRLLAEGLKTGG